MPNRHYFTTMLAALAVLIVAPTAYAQTSYAPTDDAWAVTAGGGEGVERGIAVGFAVLQSSTPIC